MENYIQYMEQVLGLKTLVWPEQEAEALPVAEEPARDSILVLFVAEKPWSAPAEELFQKMREAMKIPSHQSKVLFASEAHGPDLQIAALSAQRVVCFSQNLLNQISADSEVKFLTHNPEELLAQPALKKAAWEDLKKVMKSLGLL